MCNVRDLPSFLIMWKSSTVVWPVCSYLFVWLLSLLVSYFFRSMALKSYFDLTCESARDNSGFAYTNYFLGLYSTGSCLPLAAALFDLLGDTEFVVASWRLVLQLLVFGGYIPKADYVYFEDASIWLFLLWET